MNRSTLITLNLFLLIFLAEAQSSPQDEELDTTNFRPSLGVVLGVLSIMFSMTIILLIYAKLCNRRASFLRGAQNHAQVRSSSRLSGIDKTVIESLPSFRFSALKGSREGLECAVCLSKFEEIEVLRLLPKCKHAFHINCIDHWLEKHSSCPLCRQKVGAEDLALFKYSNSMRFLWNNQSELQEDSNVELFVQREEEDRNRGSSRFSIGSSFRKIKNGNNEEELLIEKETHKYNHKIFVSDFVFKNRWSNVNSSDMMFLKSEMLGAISSDRFSSFDPNIQQLTNKGTENEEIVKIKEEIEMKRFFENKISSVSIPNLPSTSESTENSFDKSQILNSTERRSVSEITAISRFADFNMKKNGIEESNSMFGRDLKEEKMRQIWYPIARRTVHWFANRETKISAATEHKTDVRSLNFTTNFKQTVIN